jgi:aminoglycoside phosphotransferase (APT) family kinase protein
MPRPDKDILFVLQKLGLIQADEHTRLTPLKGGVGSDIYKVQVNDRVFVVKRALHKLRVSANWEAPIERSKYEVDWLRTVGSILPDSVPRILAYDGTSGVFAMEYCPPASFGIWKNDLMAGKVNKRFAAHIGEKLVAIHSRAANDPPLAKRFQTDHIFYAIRLEPYFVALSEKHPLVGNKLLQLSNKTLACHLSLVHGDMSPKNILVGPNGPVFIDAECAWFGDPAFDVAFCLNHLLLKCILRRSAAPDLLDAFDTLAATYLEGVDWEPQSTVEGRVGELLPALLLARVDGKSPVEYITDESDRNLVRETAIPFILEPPATPFALRTAWSRNFF